MKRYETFDCFLFEALALPVEEGNELPYSDIPADSQFANAIATATTLGIVNGDDWKNTFRPHRAEVAKMVIRALEKVAR